MPEIDTGFYCGLKLLNLTADKISFITAGFLLPKELVATHTYTVDQGKDLSGDEYIVLYFYSTGNHWFTYAGSYTGFQDLMSWLFKLCRKNAQQ